MTESLNMHLEASRANIEKLQAAADRLIETITQPTLKDQARMAQRDLKEAHLWLDRLEVESRPSILHIVTVSVELASERLRMVENALKTFGPSAKR
jgi:hypothetical protein